MTVPAARRAAPGSGQALTRPCPARRRQAARRGFYETAAGDPDAKRKLRIRMVGRQDLTVAAPLVGRSLDGRDRPADGHLEECRRRKGSPSRPAGTPIADQNRRLATCIARAASATRPDARGYHASRVPARRGHSRASRAHCSDGQTGTTCDDCITTRRFAAVLLAGRGARHAGVPLL